MRLSTGFLLLVTFSTPHIGVTDGATSDPRGRSRIEELFKWKVSDALDLEPDEEAKFQDTLKQLSEKRRMATSKIDELIGKMKIVKKTEDAEGLLKDYQVQTKIMAETQDSEIESLRKIFGPKKLAQYLVLKTDLNHKLKEYLSGNTKKSESKTEPSKKASSTPKLPEPKIIEEK